MIAVRKNLLLNNDQMLGVSKHEDGSVTVMFAYAAETTTKYTLDSNGHVIEEKTTSLPYSQTFKGSDATNIWKEALTKQ